MKKQIIIFFLFSSLLAMGKPFAPIGTTWWYGTSETFSPSIDFVKFEVTDTTIIEGKMCSEITHNRSQPGCAYQSVKDYMFEEAGIVYYYVPSISEFSILYNFNAQKGDGWLIKHPDANVSVVVDSIDSVNVLGLKMKRLWLDCTPTVGFKFVSTIIETLGDSYAWYGFYNWNLSACDAEKYTGLRCYYNPDLGLYKADSTDCEYTNVSINEALRKTLKIFATDGQLFVESKEYEISAVKLISTDGSTLSEHTKLQTKLYSKTVNYKGVVLCVLSLANGEQYVEKVWMGK